MTALVAAQRRRTSRQGFQSAAVRNGPIRFCRLLCRAQRGGLWLCLVWCHTHSARGNDETGGDLPPNAVAAMSHRHISHKICCSSPSFLSHERRTNKRMALIIDAIHLYCYTVEYAPFPGPGKQSRSSLFLLYRTVISVTIHT